MIASKSNLVSGLLGLSSLLVLGIGGALLFSPQAMHGPNGVDLGTNPSLLSEIRAPAGALMGMGILMLWGAFRQAWSKIALGFSGLTMLCYGLGRIVSVLLDGLPSGVLLGAMATELVLGAILLFLAKSTKSA